MVLGIDAFNIKDGGGVTHIVEMLRVAQPKEFGFTKVIIWGDKKLLSQIDERNWLKKNHKNILEKNLIFRLFWHLFLVKKEALNYKCNVLFCPGGVSRSSFQPSVTMSRNLLPFEWKEMLRYGFSFMTFKLFFIRISQKKSFKNADGVIFLTNYARDIVTKVVKIKNDNIALIPHGVKSVISDSTHSNSLCFDKKKYNLIYVSDIRPYKHHINVVNAVFNLREKGFSISIDFIGGRGKGINKFISLLQKIDPKNKNFKYHGKINRHEMEKFYKKSDICLFASSCENMPNILLEAMTSNRPVVCSNRGPMPEILGNAGVYFNPEKVDEIEIAISEVINDIELQKNMIKKGNQKVQSFTWSKCSNQTFAFLKKIALENKINYNV